MEFRLLGAVEAWTRERRLDLGPRKQRFVFAVLALRVNQFIPVERLVDLTWPNSPPQTARHAIHVRVSQLRAALAQARADRGDGEIITRGSTYILQADPMRFDVHRFRALIRSARAEPDDAEKVSLFRQALGMWSGPPLADVATPEVVSQLCRGLEEARLVVWEECLDAELRLGRHGAVIDELLDLAVQHPYRQRVLAQLMLALYRSGCTFDALGAYKGARARLVDELGLDPERRLQQLENAILCADPSLDLVPSGRDSAPLGAAPSELPRSPGQRVRRARSPTAATTSPSNPGTATTIGSAPPALSVGRPATWTCTGGLTTSGPCPEEAGPLGRSTT